MHSRDDDNTRRPFNAFSQDFLKNDAERDEPSGGDEPEAEGPWVVLPAGAGEWEWPEAHGMWALGERPERGDAPALVGAHRTTTLLSAVVRPVIGREPFYRLGEKKWRGGFALIHDGQAHGWMEIFHPEWALGLSVLEQVARSPQAVSVLLDAAGPTCRRRAGAILLERLDSNRR
jgi:hypothetical protein